MKKQVYEITEFDLIGGVKFKTFKEANYAESKIQLGKEYFFDKETGRKLENIWHLYFFSTNKEGTYPVTDKFLPYFANVTEDLPGSIRNIGMKPKVYKNCQLMSEKHGGYLQFFHAPTGEVLRIAMNSHYYHPVK